jgi:hypothetical protein
MYFVESGAADAVVEVVVTEGLLEIGGLELFGTG